MSLFQDLEAFFSEHRRCGDLESEVSGPAGSRAGSSSSAPAGPRSRAAFGG